MIDQIIEVEKNSILFVPSSNEGLPHWYSPVRTEFITLVKYKPIWGNHVLEEPKLIWLLNTWLLNFIPVPAAPKTAKDYYSRY